MAAGEYVSVSSQADAERADLALERRELREDPAGERAELASIYRERGLSEALAYTTALRAFREGNVSIVSPLVSTHGLFALALAAIFLRDLERVTWRLVVATGLIVVGILIVMRAG